MTYLVVCKGTGKLFSTVKSKKEGLALKKELETKESWRKVLVTRKTKGVKSNFFKRL